MSKIQALEEWCALYAQDVAENPGAYDADVRRNPKVAALEIVDGAWTEAEVRRFIRDLQAERREVARARAL